MAALGVLAGAAGSRAVVVTSNDPLPEPADGYVGFWNGSTAVCVGEHWLISARHVGGEIGGLFTMRGEEYRAVEIVAHPSLDVQLIRVAEALPGHHRLATAAVPGDVALLGGCGVTGSDVYDGGYAWTGPRRETWGLNALEGVGSLISMRFDAPDDDAAAPNEATFAVNDSGAGVFVFGADGAPELAGVAVSVTGFGASVYGNRAFAVNVTTLRPWILGIVDPGAPVTSSTPAPRAGLGWGGGASAVWGGAVMAGAALGRRRRENRRRL